MAESAPWAIAARAACERDGHLTYVDGRCLRCRAYAPERTPAPLRLPTAEEEQLEEHLERMRRMMDSGDSVY